MNRVLRASILIGVLTLSSVSIAQENAPTAEDIKAAAEEFDLGRRAFRAKDYVEAAEHFESADQHAPSAAALELAIRARDRAGQLERAATLSSVVEKRYPEEATLNKLAQGILKRARAELHEAKLLCSTPCDIVVDNKIVHGHASTEWTVFFDAGNHQVRAGWSGGRTVDEEIVAERGGGSETSFEEPPIIEKAPPPPVSSGDALPIDRGPGGFAPRDRGVVVQPSGWSPAVFLTGVGLTVVLGGVTAWSGLDTMNNPGKDKVREQCVGQGTSCPLYQEGLDKQRRTNILAAATGAVGFATILVGVLGTNWRGSAERALALPRTSTAKATRSSIEPWIDIKSGATLGATGRF